MPRERLPDRRQAETVDLWHGGRRYHLTVGEYPADLPSQKEAGLCKVSFKRAPDISPSMGDWPQVLTLHVANRPTKHTRKRVRLARKQKAA